MGEQLRGGGCEGGTGDLQDTACVTVDEGGAADVLLKGAVQVNPDMLSCGHMLLAAARTFASQKIVMLARDLEELAQELGWVWFSVISVGQLLCPVWSTDRFKFSRFYPGTVGLFTLQASLGWRTLHSDGAPTLLCHVLTLDICNPLLHHVYCVQYPFGCA